MIVKKLLELDNQQPSLLTEEGSTTIPEGSTGNNIPGKKPVYHKIRNVIYKITCQGNGKFYIGSASYYDKRIGTHIHRLRRNIHDNQYLQSSYNKYGEESFLFEILEQVLSQTMLLEREQYWIDTTGCCNRIIGFNINCRADSRIGGKMPEETKKRIGDFWRGKKFSKERRERVKKDRTAAQGKPIIVYDKNMNFLFAFLSISEASRNLGVSIACISKQCSKLGGNKIRKDSKYIFRYKDIV